MSKLSEPLKKFINAAHARPNTIPAPKNVKSVYERIASEAHTKKVGLPAWLSIGTAATMTMNSPESLLELYKVATTTPSTKKIENKGVWAAELMREIGLKCIGFNGVPRTINVLGAFYHGLPPDIRTQLRERQPRRHLAPSSISHTVARGNALWDSIYHPLTTKLTDKLRLSHPDLPVFIIEGEYGALFSDPRTPRDPLRPDVGRVLTSLVAVACLRAQTGVGPQVVSHVFGLRKAFEEGPAEESEEEGEVGGRWLASDEGSLWLLEQVDRVVGALGEGSGSSFAPGFESAPRAKL